MQASVDGANDVSEIDGANDVSEIGGANDVSENGHGVTAIALWLFCTYSLFSMGGLTVTMIPFDALGACFATEAGVLHVIA